MQDLRIFDLSNIIPAEHIGLVSVYLSNFVGFSLSLIHDKYAWIKSPLIIKSHGMKKILDNNGKSQLVDCIHEMQIFPTGQWIHPREDRAQSERALKEYNRVSYARDIASALAYLNASAYNKPWSDRCDPYLEKLAHQRERGFLYGRKELCEFRDAAAWSAEYYMDNQPSVQPIPLTKLISEISNNLSYGPPLGFIDEKERITEIYQGLKELLDEAKLKALYQASAFKESPDMWKDKDLYNKFLKTIGVDGQKS